MDGGILTNALAEIKLLAFSGFGLIEGTADDVFWWIQSFAVIALLIAWFMRPAGTPVEATAPWVGLLITMTVVAALMGVFPNLSYAWLDFMQAVGFEAGGGAGGADLENISAILDAGWNAAKAVFAAMSGFSLLFATREAVVFILCFCAIILSHAFLAYRLIKLFGEFYILSVVAFFCLPFAIWQRTTFMADSSARYIVATSVSIMAMAFGYSLVHSLVGEIVFDASTGMVDVVGSSTAMTILLLIVGGLPSGIRHLMTGSPNTSFGGEARSMIYTASSAAGAARLAMAMGSTIGGAGGATAAAARGGLPSGVTMNSGFTGRAGGGGGGLAGSMATLSGPAGRSGNGP